MQRTAVLVEIIGDGQSPISRAAAAVKYRKRVERLVALSVGHRAGNIAVGIGSLVVEADRHIVFIAAYIVEQLHLLTRRRGERNRQIVNPGVRQFQAGDIDIRDVVGVADIEGGIGICAGIRTDAETQILGGHRHAGNIRRGKRPGLTERTVAADTARTHAPIVSCQRIAGHLTRISAAGDEGGFDDIVKIGVGRYFYRVIDAGGGVPRQAGEGRDVAFGIAGQKVRGRGTRAGQNVDRQGVGRRIAAAAARHREGVRAARHRAGIADSERYRAAGRNVIRTERRSQTAGQTARAQIDIRGKGIADRQRVSRRLRRTNRLRTRIGNDGKITVVRVVAVID